ncbi:TonB-dependent receptor [Hyphomonas oceanitis]|nr:TonB-dependent receptor [Hyphomonas oceanitis]
MRKSGLLMGVAAIAFGTLEPVWAQEAATADATDADGQPAGHVEDAQARLGTVVVTASRREESLQDIPIAVSAYDGAKMQDSQIDSLADLASTTPNVQISGAYTNGNISIRGIGNAAVNAGAESGVAVHLDGAYLAQPLLTLSTFLDVERVEILRGPQGTLFGRNATGGAVNIIPKTPTQELEYGFTASIGVDPDEFRSSAYVSGPLNDSGTIAGRLAYEQAQNKGYTRNDATFGPDFLDDQSVYSTRGQLEWKPSADFSSRIAVDYQSAADNGPAAYFIGTPDPMLPLPIALQGLPVGSPEDRITYANVGNRKIEALGITSTSIWSTGAGDLKALLYYNTSDLEILQDGDGTEADWSTTSFKNSGHEYFGELIFASDPSHAFSYVLGANYFFEALEQDVSVPIAILPVPVNLGGDIDTTSYAVFASGNLDLTSRLSLFGGVRYTNDEKDISEYNNFVGTLNQNDSWGELTYEAGAAFDFTADVSAYVKYNTGFKGGGYSAGGLSPAFDPETNTNIEAGLKGVYFDNTLQANLAAFHMEYEDLQVNQVIGVLSSVTNAAKATIDGLEAEFVIVPTDNLRIEASAALLDATFDEFDTADSARPDLGPLDLAGNHLPNAPEANGSVGIYYDTPFVDGDLTYGARYDWKARDYFSEFNIPLSSQDAVGTLDLSLVYKSSDDHWTASLYALNVTDETIATNVIVVSSLIGSLGLAQYEPGRQIGASISYRY